MSPVQSVPWHTEARDNRGVVIVKPYLVHPRERALQLTAPAGCQDKGRALSVMLGVVPTSSLSISQYPTVAMGDRVPRLGIHSVASRSMFASGD